MTVSDACPLPPFVIPVLPFSSFPRPLLFVIPALPSLRHSRAPLFVIPAKAGTQRGEGGRERTHVPDPSGFRLGGRNDGE